MSFFDTLDVAATGLSAQRRRINIVSANMANANTTRTSDGGPYKKQMVVFQQILEGENRGGVRIKEIVKDDTARLRYEPTHPDADEEGYVAYPNINPVEEMVNMLEASRSYEANVTVINTIKQLAQQALSIGKA
jgi:flagellar basal-body rod protein FlgC